MEQKLLLLATCLSLLMSVTGSAAAQQYDRGDFEVALIPVAARDLPGAGGSLWRTSLYVRHESDPIVVVGYNFGDDPAIILPKHTYTPPLFLSGPGEPSGALLFVDKRTAPSTHYDLRVRDVSRDSAGPGVSIPVVREQDLLSSSALLLAVPCDIRFRRMLRVYSPLSQTTTTFRVIVTDDLKNTIIYDARWQLSTSSKMLTLGGMTVPVRPSERDIDLDQVVPKLNDYSTVTVTVQPDDPGERFWAFVSVTDNTTQQVSLVLPD
jgi:hypothetical protein